MSLVMDLPGILVFEENPDVAAEYCYTLGQRAVVWSSYDPICAENTLLQNLAQIDIVIINGCLDGYRATKRTFIETLRSVFPGIIIATEEPRSCNHIGRKNYDFMIPKEGAPDLALLLLART